jgi:cobalamin biosynthesis protein CobW
MNSYFDRPWAANEKRETRLVVIGVKGMDQQAVTQALLG